MGVSVMTHAGEKLSEDNQFHPVHLPLKRRLQPIFLHRREPDQQGMPDDATGILTTDSLTAWLRAQEKRLQVQWL